MCRALQAAAQVLVDSVHSSSPWRWTTTMAVLELPNHLLSCLAVSHPPCRL